MHEFMHKWGSAGLSHWDQSGPTVERDGRRLANWPYPQAGGGAISDRAIQGEEPQEVGWLALPLVRGQTG